MFWEKPKKILAHRQGHSLIEMLLVLMLLLIFGLGTFALVFSAGDAYGSLLENKDHSADARIIISMLNTRLRQYDYQNGIALEELHQGGALLPALVFSEPFEGKQLKTWLFWHEGALWEAITLRDENPLPLAQSLLTNAALELTLRQEGNQLHLTAAYPFHGEKRSLSSVYTPRSWE